MKQFHDITFVASLLGYKTEQTQKPEFSCSERCPDCHPRSCRAFFECDEFFKQEGKS